MASRRLASSATLALLALTLAPASAGALPPALPLGDPELRERRSTSTPAPGVTWTRIVRSSPLRIRSADGPWLVNVLEIDRARLSGRLTAVQSNDRTLGHERTSSMAARHGARAGVNGGFFTFSGDSAGALVVGGRLLSEPIAGRSALLVPRSSTTPAAVATLGFRGGVRIGGTRRLLDGVDRARGLIPNCGGRGGDVPTQRPRFIVTCRDPSELVLYSPRYSAATRTPPGGVESVVREGAVTVTRAGANTPIPANGYVLSGTGDAAAFLRAQARPGVRPEIATTLARGSEAVSPAAYEAVVSGGPALVVGGAPVVRSAAEGFGLPGVFGSFVAARNPRTLAGVTTGGGVLLVTVDGRRRGVSVGLTLSEAARLMRALGARSALNLDGGGSTTMVVSGRVVNRPSDPRGERPVSDGIYVVP